jgi:aspartyl/glutamyl-tRNA(Asn/Gln) amidotransferase C subunit
MWIDETQVRKLAELARLELSDEEIPSLVKELDGVLEHLGRLATVRRAAGETVTAAPREATRADDPRPGIGPDAVSGLPAAWIEPFVLSPPNPALGEGGAA